MLCLSSLGSCFDGFCFSLALLWFCAHLMALVLRLFLSLVLLFSGCCCRLLLVACCIILLYLRGNCFPLSTKILHI